VASNRNDVKAFRNPQQPPSLSWRAPH